MFPILPTVIIYCENAVGLDVPVIDFGYSDLPSALAETDPGGRGVGQDVASDRLLWVSLETIQSKHDGKNKVMRLSLKNIQIQGNDVWNHKWTCI